MSVNFICMPLDCLLFYLRMEDVPVRGLHGIPVPLLPDVFMCSYFNMQHLRDIAINVINRWSYLSSFSCRGNWLER